MTKTDNIQSILDRATISVPNVYSVGCLAKRVTFHSQQNRALNLVWALFESRVIAAGTNVAVIGGGLAGMTASIALKQKGCNVTLFEASNLLMLMQNGNTTRYIHPNIYDWPKVGSANPETRLPFLNWKAGLAKDVRATLLQQWANLSTDIKVIREQKIDRIEYFDDKIHLSARKNSLMQSFDCVLIATGFGAEKTVNGIDFRSYWSNDSLHQSEVKDSDKELSYLITGCGDGGLIDAQRLLIEEFDHDKFTNEFINHSFVKPLLDDINDIEVQIQDHYIKGSTIDIDVFANEQYNKLKIPDDLLDYLKVKIRKNTKVTLNSGSRIWTSFKATALNRFVVFLLKELNLIHYIPGQIVEAVRDGNQYRVSIKYDGKMSPNTFDRVIVRHGPMGSILDLLPTAAPAPTEFKNDPTNVALWDLGFYTATVAKPQLPTQLKKDLNDLTDQHIYRDGVVFIGPGKEGNNIIISIVLEKGNSSVSENDFPKNLSGVPVKITFQEKSPTPQYFYGTNLAPFWGTLEIGSPIATVLMSDENEDVLVWGSIGCFVKLRNGQIGFLSTNHTIARDNKATANDMIITRNSSVLNPKIVGHPSRFVPLNFQEYTRPNTVDCAIGIINEGQHIDPILRLGSRRILIDKVGDADFSDRVYKLGAGSGMTYGVVTSISGTVKMQYNGRKIWFDDIFQVSNIDGVFSKAGDSGALVFKEDGTAVGIVFAGADQSSFVFPIRTALELLQCSLLNGDE